MNPARRAILKLIGASPASVVAAPKMLASAVASIPAPLAAAASTAATVGLPQSADEVARKSILGPFLHKRLDRLSRQVSDQQWQVSTVRQQQFDSDIACMKSWSLATKSRIQMRRHIEENELLERVRAMLWGN